MCVITRGLPVLLASVLPRDVLVVHRAHLIAQLLADWYTTWAGESGARWPGAGRPRPPGPGPARGQPRRLAGDCLGRRRRRGLMGVALVIPASARMMSNRAGYLPSRSRIKYFTRQPVSVSWRSMTRFRAACLAQAGRVGGGAENTDPAGDVLDDGQDVESGTGQCRGFEEVGGDDSLRLTAQERRPRTAGALGCRVNAGLLEDLPDGGGGDLDTQHEQFTVDAAVSQVGFSRARRRTSRRTDRIVGGRPALRGRERRVCRPAIKSRCQRRTVSGRTSSRTWPSTSRGNECSRAASHARSAHVNRTRSPCNCRSRTMIWCRSARISMSLSRSLIDSSRSRARVLVTPR